MKALILIAHGSRLEAANKEILHLTETLRSKAARDFDQVAAAFLELATPSIPDAIQQCIDSGAEQIVLLPYFLASGKHVATDIPSEVDKKREQYPDIEIQLLDYFGKSSQIADMLLSHLGSRGT